MTIKRCLLENGEWEARKASHMLLIRREVSGSADGVIVNDLNVGEIGGPIILSFVHNPGQYLCHSVVDAFSTLFCVWVEGGRDEFVNPPELVGCMRKVRAEPRLQDMSVWHLFITQGRMRKETYLSSGLLPKRRPPAQQAHRANPRNPNPTRLIGPRS